MDCAILNDKRQIEMISWPNSNEGPGQLTVGQFGVVSIVVERVAGQGAYVPWFLATSDDGSRNRVNAAFVDYVKYVKYAKYAKEVPEPEAAEPDVPDGDGLPAIETP